MTKVIKKNMFCKNCNKYFEVPVMLSTNSFMIEKDPELKKKYENGTLFKNFCPECGKELINRNDNK